MRKARKRFIERAFFGQTKMAIYFGREKPLTIGKASAIILL